MFSLATQEVIDLLYVRQTSLTLEEIGRALECRDPEHQDCMLVNEVGTIMVNREEEYQEAERWLVSWLSSEDPKFRAIAGCYLCTARAQLKSESTTKLQAFMDDPANAEIVEFIRRNLAQQGVAI